MKVLAWLLFIVGFLQLVGLSILILTGDEALLAQIGLGVWSMCFLLAAIFMRVAEAASKMTTTHTKAPEDGS